MQGLGYASINFNNKAYRPVPTIRIYMVNRNHMDLCLQGSGDLRKCGSQTDQNIALFLDDVSMFYEAFCVNLMWHVCCCRACTYIRV